MELVLALDLKGGFVVHGMSGRRDQYRPLTWGIPRSAEPLPFVKALSPRSVYIADLDRITGAGSHDRDIRAVAGLVDRCYVDRGCRSPQDYLMGVVNIVGTETGGPDLSLYHGGYLSVDVRDGKTIPSGEDPVSVLSMANRWDFEGCILLDMGSVGTEGGLSGNRLPEIRAAYEGRLLYGGGIAGTGDLDLLDDTGFDGAIVATAVHRGSIPVVYVREGHYARHH
ncbi:MAG: nickel transporter [Methanoregulaceae archaeon]|nr:nickel transporter [Methanoregulaceae archaeon]